MIKEFDMTRTSTTNRNVKHEVRATAAGWAVSNENLDTIPAERNLQRELAGDELKHVSGGAMMAYAYLTARRQGKL